MYNKEKFERLRHKIQVSNVSEEEKKFLNIAATRHIIFNYQSIADLRINHKLEHPTGRYLIIKNIDNVFYKTLEYFINSNFTSICYSQGGDWFGGATNFNKKPKRKAMNSFFCSIDRRFWFVSRLNEDVNTYMALGHQGHVFMTIPFIQLDQKTTQKTQGGMSDAYLAGGTYVKTFYTLLARPDCTKINLMGRTDLRMHHSINWNNAVPCIINEKHKIQ